MSNNAAAEMLPFDDDDFDPHNDNPFALDAATEPTQPVCLGLTFTGPNNVGVSTITRYIPDVCDLIAVPIIEPVFDDSDGDSDIVTPLSFPASTFSQHFIAVANTHTDDDSDRLQALVDYCHHLSIQSILLNDSKSDRELMVPVMVSNPTITFVVVVPFTSTHESLTAYHRLLSVAHHPANIALSLYIGPDECGDSASLSLYSGDVIHSVMVSYRCFVTNRRGFPVLNRYHSALVLQILGYTSILMLAHTDTADSDMITHCLHYLHRLKSYYHYYYHHRHSQRYQALVPYRDLVQSPLQPLKDNLENCVYEVFEADSVKYERYTQAITLALADTGLDSVVIWIIGAGRGPLIDCCLQATLKVEKKIRIFAFEKNRFALLTLRTRQRHYRHWAADTVTIIDADIRLYDNSERKLPRADIIVSELLGSFGDNECSAECLDRAQSFLVKGGISIPCQSQSYMTPIYSATLHQSLTRLSNSGSDSDRRKVFETNYVCQLYRYATIDSRGQNQCAFTFRHPKSHSGTYTDDSDSGKNSGGGYDGVTVFEDHRHNRRAVTLTYFSHPYQPTILTGLLGSFTATLYRDVTLSIVPGAVTAEMYSWFPLYFPVLEPIAVPADSAVNVNLRRCVDGSRVWYEWQVSVRSTVSGAELYASPLHNPNGRSSFIGLT